MNALENMQHPIEYDPMGWADGKPYYCNECDEAFDEDDTCVHNATLDRIVKEVEKRVRGEISEACLTRRDQVRNPDVALGIEDAARIARGGNA